MNNHLIEKLAVQSLVAHGGELIFSKERFAELIVRECDRYVAEQYDELEPWMQPGDLLKHFGVKE